MNWLKGASPIDELVDKATSENLPAGSEDLAMNLEICDQIRSKQVPPKDAARALKRRIGHKNPNVQLLALGLTDVCVKNGGQHFLVEVASREFIDNLTSILKLPTGCNLDVRNKILALIQSWGNLFRGKQGLGYVCDTYMMLRHEGYEFPPEDNVGAALVETQAPPDWTDSDVCTRCRTEFTFTNRKHHCRACGSTFCGRCSSKNMSLPHLGINQEVRVCDGCWIKKKMGGKGTAVHDSFGPGGPPEIVNGPSQPFVTPSSGASRPPASHEDEDLKRAIELSLQEANSRPGYSAPSSTRKEPEPSRTTTARTEEEDDADLLAAIEASLRETKLDASRSEQKQSAYAAYTYTSAQETVANSANTLTSTEKENIEMFSSLVDRIQIMNGDVAGNQEVQALYEQISRLQMKLAASIEEADRKQREAIQFNEKIDQAVKLYDHLLQERLHSAYQRRVSSYGHSGIPTQTEAPHMGYNVTGTPHTPHSSHAYPHLTGSDSRYNPYVPGAPYAPQPIESFAPHAPPQAVYQHQASQPPASSPFVAPMGISGPEYPTAPFISPAPTQTPVQGLAPPVQSMASQPGYQPAQDPFYASAPISSAMPSTQPLGQYPSQGFQGMPGQLAPTANNLSGQYAPYSSQVTPQAYAPAAPVAPVVPVEEKPLIEL